MVTSFASVQVMRSVQARPASPANQAKAPSHLFLIHASKPDPDPHPSLEQEFDRILRADYSVKFNGFPLAGSPLLSKLLVFSASIDLIKGYAASLPGQGQAGSPGSSQFLELDIFDAMRRLPLSVMADLYPALYQINHHSPSEKLKSEAGRISRAINFVRGSGRVISTGKLDPGNQP